MAWKTRWILFCLIGSGCLYDPTGMTPDASNGSPTTTTGQPPDDTSTTNLPTVDVTQGPLDTLQTAGSSGTTEEPDATTGTTAGVMSTGSTSGSTTATTDVMVGCGNGVVEADELCDAAGESPSCDVDCTPAECGDGVVNASAGELCEDGNDLPGDACDANCVSTAIEGVALGRVHTCLVFTSGRVRCWGGDEFGSLGYEDTLDRGGQPGDLPTPDVDLGGEVVQVGAGDTHTCAVLASGAVRCWGDGEYGKLGNGSQDSVGAAPGDMPPLDVPGVEAVEVGAGGSFTCARLVDGHVRCWGFNDHGELGLENTDTQYAPGLDVIGVEQVNQLAVGSEHACALSAGVVRCWGRNFHGPLGLGHTVNIGATVGSMPPDPVPLGGTVTRIAAGLNHTCALLQGGNVQCWGFGQALGYGSSLNVGDNPGELPHAPVALGGAAVEITAGTQFTCAQLTSGKLKCWGRGDQGSLGSASTADVGTAPNQMPPADVDLGGDVTLLGAASGGAYHLCATLAGGGLRCWGGNSRGQLGLGHLAIVGDDETPASQSFIPY